MEARQSRCAGGDGRHGGGKLSMNPRRRIHMTIEDSFQEFISGLGKWKQAWNWKRPKPNLGKKGRKIWLRTKTKINLGAFSFSFVETLGLNG